jgi:hypothetical protein
VNTENRREKVARELMRWITPYTKWENAGALQREYYLSEADRLLAIAGVRLP